MVGNEAIDADHQHLFSLANKVRDGLLVPHSTYAAGDVLEELLTYAREHFAREEELMKVHRYAEQEGHIVEHRLLTYRLYNMHFRCVNGEKLSNEELDIFLDRWLARHILTADLHLAKSIRNAQRKSTEETR